MPFTYSKPDLKMCAALKSQKASCCYFWPLIVQIHFENIAKRQTLCWGCCSTVPRPTNTPKAKKKKEHKTRCWHSLSLTYTGWLNQGIWPISEHASRRHNHLHRGKPSKEWYLQLVCQHNTIRVAKDRPGWDLVRNGIWCFLANYNAGKDLCKIQPG